VKIWIVELSPGVWTADWNGDPGRTLVFGSAKYYQTEKAASKDLKRCREYRPFLKAQIYPIEIVNTQTTDGRGREE